MSTTLPLRRRYKVAILVGIISGIIGAIVKFGWEVPFPPRTPERDATNPPQAMLELLGFSPDFTHATYTYSGQPRPFVSFLIHFGFSIFFAALYAVIAEKYPRIKMWQGTVYGVAIWFIFHIVIMPMMGVVPAPWDQPIEEHLSEFFGHAFWMWVIELTRRDLRNRITHEPDAEVMVDDPAGRVTAEVR
jgi:putative membrane protein